MKDNADNIKKRLKQRFGHVPAAARGDACEDGKGGRPGMRWIRIARQERCDNILPIGG